MKVAIVTPAIHNPERLFGAERLFAGLVAAFQTKAQTDWIQVPTGERRWEGILQGYLHCYDLDLSAYDLVISTKNPTFAVQHPNHICWLVHQIASSMTVSMTNSGPCRRARSRRDKTIAP